MQTTIIEAPKHRDYSQLVNSTHFVQWSLLALWLGLCLFNFMWLKADTRPPTYDLAHDATTVARMLRLPFITNPAVTIQGLLTLSNYPPLVYYLSLPLGAVFWPTADVLTSVNMVFLGILILSTYGIARKFVGKGGSLVAAFLASTYPIIAGLTRLFLLDIALTAMAALAIWLLIQSDLLEQRAPALAFGVSLGLGMLTKWTLLAFLIMPLCVAIVRIIARRSGRAFMNLLLALVAGGLIAGPWYLANLQDILSLRQVLDAQGTTVAYPAVLSLGAWLWNITDLVNSQILLPLTLLFALGLILLLAKHARKFETLILLGWILGAYVIFALLINKDARNTIPYLPAMAIITAVGLAQIRPLKLRTFLIVLTIAYSVVEYVGLGWGLSGHGIGRLFPPRIYVAISSLKLTLYSEFVYISTPARSEDWQVQNILRDVTRVSVNASLDRPARLTLLANADYCEINVFTYFTLVDHQPIDVGTVTGSLPVPNAREIVISSDFLLTKTGRQGPEWSIQGADRLAREVADKNSDIGHRFHHIGDYQLPDGSRAELWQRNST